MPMGALPLALLLAASGLARIRAQGEVRWGGDLQGGEPYVFRDPRDPEKLVGFEVDLVRALAPSLGVASGSCTTTGRTWCRRSSAGISI